VGFDDLDSHIFHKFIYILDMDIRIYFKPLRRIKMIAIKTLLQLAMIAIALAGAFLVANTSDIMRKKLNMKIIGGYDTSCNNGMLRRIAI